MVSCRCFSSFPLNPSIEPTTRVGARNSHRTRRDCRTAPEDCVYVCVCVSIVCISNRSTGLGIKPAKKRRIMMTHGRHLYMSVFLPACLADWLTVCLSVSLSVSVCVCLSVCLSVSLSVSVCLSVCLYGMYACMCVYAWITIAYVCLCTGNGNSYQTNSRFQHKSEIYGHAVGTKMGLQPRGSRCAWVKIGPPPQNKRNRLEKSQQSRPILGLLLHYFSCFQLV